MPHFAARCTATFVASFMLLAAGSALLQGCATESTGGSLAEASSSYLSADYRRTITLARVTADRSQGLEHDRARYLEGIAHYKLSEFDAAAKALGEARTTSDRWLAAQANVTLASVEVARKHFDAAGYAFERAANLLDGAEKTRAFSSAARCFDAAGLGKLAENARVSAGEPKVLIAASPAAAEPMELASAESVSPQEMEPAPVPAPTPASTSAAAAPPSEQPRAKIEKPSDRTVRNGMAVQASRFAIQAGAFETLAKAKRIAKEYRARAAAAKVDAPRVVTTEGKDGALLYVVQFGDFPNRGEADRARKRFTNEPLVVRPYIDGDDHAG